MHKNVLIHEMFGGFSATADILVLRKRTKQLTKGRI